jgi:hypothetical protein
MSKEGRGIARFRQAVDKVRTQLNDELNKDARLASYAIDDALNGRLEHGMTYTFKTGSK